MNACRKKPAAPLHPIPVPKKKWSLVGMDIIGPLQVTDRGNQYIVALTDHFTKFPVAKAIPCKSSEEVARFMYETICIFGAFDSLITDQGREFINFALDILTDRFNINHRISSAYHPETNGQRERDNRTLKDTLVKITDNDDWDELLPAALFAYRTSVHKSTQFSPFLALYGEQAKLPFDVTGDANEQDLNEEIMDTMKGIHEEVKNKIGENISRAQKKQKEYYDSRRAYDHGFRIGDKVLIINAARVHRMGGKMAPRFVGPYESATKGGLSMTGVMVVTLFLEGVFILLPGLYRAQAEGEEARTGWFGEGYWLALLVVVFTWVETVWNWWRTYYDVANYVRKETKQTYFGQTMETPPGSCIGFYNQRHFVMFCVYVIWGCMLALYLQLSYLNLSLPIAETFYTYIAPVTIVQFLTGNLSLWTFLLLIHVYATVVFMCVAIFFLTWQLVIIIRGQTSYEAWKMIRIYDTGLWGNITSVFGSPVWSWALLFAPLMLPMGGDGVKWNIKAKPDKGH
nr:hypothetical protein BaRGS_020156 [Batillaria attramentaria]